LGDLGLALQAMKRAALLQAELDQYAKSQMLRDLHELVDLKMRERCKQGAQNPQAAFNPTC
jgi:hypothetical protein